MRVTASLCDALRDHRYRDVLACPVHGGNGSIHRYFTTPQRRGFGRSTLARWGVGPRGP